MEKAVREMSTLEALSDLIEGKKKVEIADQDYDSIFKEVVKQISTQEKGISVVNNIINSNYDDSEILKAELLSGEFEEEIGDIFYMISFHLLTRRKEAGKGIKCMRIASKVIDNIDILPLQELSTYKNLWEVITAQYEMFDDIEGYITTFNKIVNIITKTDQLGNFDDRQENCERLIEYMINDGIEIPGEKELKLRIYNQMIIIRKELVEWIQDNWQEHDAYDDAFDDAFIENIEQKIIEIK